MVDDQSSAPPWVTSAGPVAVRSERSGWELSRVTIGDLPAISDGAERFMKRARLLLREHKH